jgi:hypothetical protein
LFSRKKHPIEKVKPKRVYLKEKENLTRKMMMMILILDQKAVEVAEVAVVVEVINQEKKNLKNCKNL